MKTGTTTAIIRKKASVDMTIVLVGSGRGAKIIPRGTYNVKIVTDAFGNARHPEELVARLHDPDRRRGIDLTRKEYRHLCRNPSVQIH